MFYVDAARCFVPAVLCFVSLFSISCLISRSICAGSGFASDVSEFFKTVLFDMRGEWLPDSDEWIAIGSRTLRSDL